VAGQGHTSFNVNKTVTLVIISTFSFNIAFLTSAVNIALPSMGKELSMDAVLLGWVNNAMILAIAAVLIPAGRLADIYGRRRMFLYGILLAAVSSFFCAVATSSTLVILSRVLIGISGGMTIGTSVAILTSVFPAAERGRALGMSVAAVYLGISAGPFLGGILTQHLGWRSIFFLSAGLSLLASVLVLWKLKGEWAEARGEKFDLIGAIAFGLSIVIVLYGFAVLPATLGIVLIVMGALFMVAFVRLEARVKNPLLNVGILRKNTAFVFSNLATLINYSATYAVIFLMSLYLQYTKGLSPQDAGLILLTQPVVMTMCSPFAGRISDRIEPKIVASAGMSFNCTALVLLVFLTNETALGYILGSLAIFGLGMGFFVSPNTSAVMGSVEKKLLGVASGTQATMRNVGMALSMGIAMILFSIYIGKAQITPEYYPVFLTSIRAGFTIFAILCFGGIFIQLAGMKGGKASRANSAGELQPNA